MILGTNPHRTTCDRNSGAGKNDALTVASVLIPAPVAVEVVDVLSALARIQKALIVMLLVLEPRERYFVALIPGPVQ
jgi:hypothetical protein